MSRVGPGRYIRPVIENSGNPRLSALIDAPDGGVLALPPGRVVSDDHGPVLWLSDDVPDVATVARLRALHPVSGLWPVLLGDDASWGSIPGVVTDPDPERPWLVTSPFYPLLRDSLGKPLLGPGSSDAEAWLAAEWDEAISENEESEYWEPEERVSALAPNGTTWPGLAPAADLVDAPLASADRHAALIFDEGWLGRPRLALFEGSDSTGALASARWAPSELDDFRDHIAVLRSWEQRFGARVVALKPDTLYLSVAAPPRTPGHAAHVACEHLVFSPDTVWQASGSFEEHIENLVDSPCWGFWWD